MWSYVDMEMGALFSFVDSRLFLHSIVPGNPISCNPALSREKILHDKKIRGN